MIPWCGCAGFVRSSVNVHGWLNPLRLAIFKGIAPVVKNLYLCSFGVQKLGFMKETWTLIDGSQHKGGGGRWVGVGVGGVGVYHCYIVNN